MTPTVDRVNRVLLIVIGAVVLVAGVLLLLVSGGAFGSYAATSSVIPEQATLNMRANQSWFWPVLAVLLLIIAALCAWWVMAQLRTHSVAQLELERSPEGNVIVSGHALAECLEQDCESIPGIARARVRVASDNDRVSISVTAWIGAPYDINRSVELITTNVLPHLNHALDTEKPTQIDTTIHIETTAAPVSRLR